MSGPSWASWHLGLGLALLLGQLACGAEGCCECQCQGCCNEAPSSSEEQDKANSWEHNAEFMYDMARRHLEEAAAYEASVVPDYFKHIAVSHYNDHSPGPYFRHLEDTQLKAKKALGTMAYLRLILEETDCYKDDQEDRFVTYTNEYLNSLGCGLPPETDRMKMECTFSIFMDARSGREAVVSHTCEPLRNPEESLPEDLQ